MDLGLKDRNAIVCASSRGLGYACAESLAREGANVVINGRNADTLAEAARSLEKIAIGSVTAIVSDINTESGREELLAAFAAPDILVNNNGGPPPGRFSDWQKHDWLGALESNLLAPVFMIQQVIDGMKERHFGRIVNITSAMVKTPLAPMGLSTAARTGLTAACKGLSPELAPFNVTINNLLPERFDTERQQQMARLVMAAKQITYEQAREEMISSIAAKRLGIPSELGDACAFLCSRQAGFISGQNLQMDGGSYKGLI